jgi:hypothetical protein
MTVLVVHHRVRGFDAGEPVFDGHAASRRPDGAERRWVYRTLRTQPRVCRRGVLIGGASRGVSEGPHPRRSHGAGRSRGPRVHARERTEVVKHRLPVDPRAQTSGEPAWTKRPSPVGCRLPGRDEAADRPGPRDAHHARRHRRRQGWALCHQQRGLAGGRAGAAHPGELTPSSGPALR